MEESSMTTSHPQGEFHLTAEDVLPGHPDRLCDAIAESIVDRAMAVDTAALVGVEVGIHREMAYVTGRIAAGDVHSPIRLDLDAIANDVYAWAGYSGIWQLRPRIEADLDLGPLSPEERSIRGFSDDQNLVVGYAVDCEATGFLPLPVFLARRLRRALSELREACSDHLGPDGKVLVRLHPGTGGPEWRRLNIAIQHAEGLGYHELHQLTQHALEPVLDECRNLVPHPGKTWGTDLLRLNGAGEFSCGGPRGDNGLSGKKLVVDHYGPGVPIGGGALCGKDPHKVDRIGALCARQLALRLVRATGAPEVTTHLGYLPGLEAPDMLAALIGGEWWDADRIARAIHLPDLTIDGSFDRLLLECVAWTGVLRDGYFGGDWKWER
jgi:S-adenosylmethionine synthetase